MIGELKPYPAYKDSGIPWLGEVPEHWKLMPNRALLRKRKVLVGDRHDKYQLLSLTKAGVIVRDVSTGRGKFSADMGTSQEVRRGDLVFCLFDVPETPRTVGLAKYDGMITGAYTIFECRNNQLARFIEAFYIAMDDRKLLSPLYSGLRNTIPPPVFLGAKTPVPPTAEQAAIATFLDFADRRIRRYIRSKQKLIKLLEEQKQVIINQAVTRGLDPNAPLKPSGIEWLGGIPDHWKVSRLKFEASQIIDCLHATPEYTDDGIYPAIRTADIEPGKLRLKTMRRVNREQYLLWTSRMTPEAGDILYSREGERFGIAALVPEGIELCISQRMMAFRIRSPQDSEFLMWQLNCRHVYAQASADIIGATSPHVNVERIKNYEIVLPPLSEQKHIASAIAKRCSDLEKAIACTHDDISLFREFRTRLIADVVTGKLDVSEAAAHLPNEGRDLELEEEPLDPDETEEAGEGDEGTLEDDGQD